MIAVNFHQCCSVLQLSGFGAFYFNNDEKKIAVKTASEILACKIEKPWFDCPLDGHKVLIAVLGWTQRGHDEAMAMLGFRASVTGFGNGQAGTPHPGESATVYLGDAVEVIKCCKELVK